jgi:hypothetical protein
MARVQLAVDEMRPLALLYVSAFVPLVPIREPNNGFL